MSAGPDHVRLLLSRLVLFGLVGTSGVLVNVAIFSTLTALGVGYLPAGVAAAVGAMAWNFLGNDAVTFDDGGRHLCRRHRAARFGLVYGLGLLVAASVLRALVEEAHLAPGQANLAAIAAAAGWHFVGSRGFVWPDAIPAGAVVRGAPRAQGEEGEG